MKYSTEIEINKPIDEVIQLFDNPDNLYKWMEGLQSFTHISGTPGEPGAKSKLVFKMGKRSIEMIETVITRDLPREFTGSYETKGVFNMVKNRFEKISDDKTRYISEQEFRFSGIMKFISFLMPDAFRKQSGKYLESFKQFAESN